jgi:ABC-type uncharacterized transport system permease subunit
VPLLFSFAAVTAAVSFWLRFWLRFILAAFTLVNVAGCDLSTLWFVLCDFASTPVTYLPIQVKAARTRTTNPCYLNA